MDGLQRVYFEYGLPPDFRLSFDLGHLIWDIVGVGDYNEDGKADLVWQNSLGRNVYSYMDGATNLGYESFRNLEYPEEVFFWKIEGPR